MVFSEARRVGLGWGGGVECSGTSVSSPPSSINGFSR